MNPAWRLSLLELVDPFGWHRLSGQDLKDIRSRLVSFESMTWSEILIRDKKHNHFVRRDQICADAERRLKDIKQDDVDEIVSLKVMARERVWGIMDGGVLKILWWDPQHRICPSKPR